MKVLRNLKHSWPAPVFAPAEDGKPALLEDLLSDVEQVIYERGAGLPVPAIIGVLDILKRKILADAEDD